MFTVSTLIHIKRETDYHTKVLQEKIIKWSWLEKALKAIYRYQDIKISKSTVCETKFTLMLRARLSISEVHFLIIKGIPSGLFLAAWAKSIPNRWSLPCSFLWPHWIASVSRHFLWQANEHWQRKETKTVKKLSQTKKNKTNSFRSQMATHSGCLLYLPFLNASWQNISYITQAYPQAEKHYVHCTSSHSAPWKTTRLSHSLHLDGARSFLSLWVWAALDIWAFLKGPGELAVSVTISARPENQSHSWRNSKDRWQSSHVKGDENCN